jgi:hypothetical protein
MAFELKLRYLAPIPVGNRVQVIHAQKWIKPILGGPWRWEPDPSPILVDLETSIIYAGWVMANVIVPTPLGFTPNSGYQVAQTVEGKVVGCLCISDGGDTATVRTRIQIEPTPEGYRK